MSRRSKPRGMNLTAHAGAVPRDVAVRLEAHKAVADGRAEAVATQTGEVVFFTWEEAYDRRATPALDRLGGQREWVNYGDDNLLPQKMLDLNRLSVTHAAAIKKKTRYTAGSSLVYGTEALKDFCEAQDGGNGMSDLFKKITLDYWTYGGFALQVIWKKYQHEVHGFHYMDFAKLRRGFTGSPNEDREYPQVVWYSNDWSRASRGANKYYRPVCYPYFDPNEHCDGVSILYHIGDTQGSDWYPLPSWFPAFIPASGEIELHNYMYWSVNRGFTPSGILRIPQRMAPANVDALKDQVKSMSGTKNAGKILVAMADSMTQTGSDTPVEWIPFTNNPADRDVSGYLDIWKQSIVTAHELPSPAVAGISVSTGLQSDAALLEIAMEKFEDSLADVQFEIMAVLKDLIELAGFDSPDIKVAQKNPQLENPEDVAPAPDDPLAQLRATVGGIQAVQELQRSVRAGELTYDMGIALLTEGFGYNDFQAQKLLSGMQNVQQVPIANPNPRT